MLRADVVFFVCLGSIWLSLGCESGGGDPAAEVSIAVGPDATSPSLTDISGASGDVVGTATDGVTATADGVTATTDGVTAAAEGTLGASCVAADECDSGWCVPTTIGTVCTRGCLDPCPIYWSCEEAETGTVDPVFLCVPEDDHPCTGDVCGDGFPSGLPNVGEIIPTDQDGDGIPDDEDNIPCRAIELQVGNVGVSSGEVVFNGEILLDNNSFPTTEVLRRFINAIVGTNVLELGGKLGGSPGDSLYFRVVDDRSVVYLEEIVVRASGKPEAITYTFEVDVDCDG